MTAPWFVGADVGGTGIRIAAAMDKDTIWQHTGPGPQITENGSNARQALTRELTAFVQAHPELRDGRVAAFACGITGLITLGEDPHLIAQDVAEILNTKRCAIASDMVTAHIGALGGKPGAVLAAGTGAVALGTDFKDTWRQVDGAGHLLGDLGSGAWIGIAALKAAQAHLDGRTNLGSAELAERAIARYGPPETWPGQFYPAPDRAGRIAAFAADVGEAAETDTTAKAILAKAGRLLAETLAAALAPPVPQRASITGGVVVISPTLLERARARLAILNPTASLETPRNNPLDGALSLAVISTLGFSSTPAHPNILTLISD